MARGRQGKAQEEAATELGTSGATTGYEAELWQMADALRGSVWMRPNTSMSSLGSSF